MERMMRNYCLIAALLLEGCVANGHNGIRPLRPLELATSPYEGKIASAHTGSLMYENGCLLFREDESEARFLPVWPTGSIFNGTSVIFHEPGKTDQPVLVAQQFVMEGSALSWAELQGIAYAPFEHQCGSQPFAVAKVRLAD
jgi:hypothetical protein